MAPNDKAVGQKPARYAKQPAVKGRGFEILSDLEKAPKVRAPERHSSDAVEGSKRGAKAKSGNSTSRSRQNRQPPGAFPKEKKKKGSSTDSTSSVYSDTDSSLTLPFVVSKNVTTEPDTISDKTFLDKIVDGATWRSNLGLSTGSSKDPFERVEQQIIEDVIHARRELTSQILENTRQGLGYEEASDILTHKIDRLNKKEYVRRYNNFVQGHMRELSDLTSNIFSLAFIDVCNRTVFPHYGEPWLALTNFVKYERAEAEKMERQKNLPPGLV